jgi:DNA-binding MarR family transcriptional regulator
VTSSANAAHAAAVDALMVASRAFAGLTARSLTAAEGEVTLPQFRTLVVLAVRGPQRGTDIAEELQISPSSGTRMLDRLARKGLVRRTRSSTDRREIQLHLTRDGQTLVHRVLTHRRKDLEQLVASTESLWQPVVIAALTSFAKAVGEPEAADWWQGWSTSSDAHASTIAQAKDGYVQRVRERRDY